MINLRKNAKKSFFVIEKIQKYLKCPALHDDDFSATSTSLAAGTATPRPSPPWRGSTSTPAGGTRPRTSWSPGTGFFKDRFWNCPSGLCRRKSWFADLNLVYVSVSRCNIWLTLTLLGITQSAQADLCRNTLPQVCLLRHTLTQAGIHS